MNIVNVGYDSTNYYVLEQNRIRLLIDVGWPGTLPKLRGSLKRLGLTLKDLHYLLTGHWQKVIQREAALTRQQTC